MARHDPIQAKGATQRRPGQVQRGSHRDFRLVPTLSIPRPVELSLPGAELLLFESLGLQDEQSLLDHLIRETPWRQEDITLFGKTHPQPRLVAWYGDPGSHYSYSGIQNTPQSWSADLQRLRSAVESACGHAFNSVLLNYYRNGRDSMGMHADDESELGPEPVIASLSLGESRKLRFVHRRGDEQPLSLPLQSGSLLIMRGDTQRNWKHGINKVSRPCGPRVNLTFRRIMGVN